MRGGNEGGVGEGSVIGKGEGRRGTAREERGKEVDRESVKGVIWVEGNDRKGRGEGGTRRKKGERGR